MMFDLECDAINFFVERHNPGFRINGLPAWNRHLPQWFRSLKQNIPMLAGMAERGRNKRLSSDSQLTTPFVGVVSLDIAFYQASRTIISETSGTQTFQPVIKDCLRSTKI
mmetsp:Transcript_4869/g.11409  ORF Transcript_4869/g.11409 Transcript_4869/m.11409 type:complete len:110 (-) Transcript_4869:1323-1652(-)